MKFLDEAKIFLASGHGGNGCLSFRREKFVEFGGPDGGNGGHGGDIFFEAVDNLNTLIDYRYKQHFKAPAGEPGMGKNRTGASAKSLVLKVPVGTQVIDENKQNILFDLNEKGKKVRVLSGGHGGHGNAHFKSSENRAPRRTQPGGPGEELWVWLRLKLIADVGLVGLPNAGKSTFLSTVTEAKPKIADYPFTTLYPQLGIVRCGYESFVIADIPGLIEGAHEGRGLGHRFLGHVERCQLLLHLIDCTAEDVLENYHLIQNELEAYHKNLAQKERILVLTKTDLLPKDVVDEKILYLKNALKIKNIFSISSATQQGVQSLISQLHERTKKDEAVW